MILPKRRLPLATDICIIDDNIEYLEASTHLFEHHGFSVNTLEDPENALQFLHEKNPKLLILDIMMPHMDGFTLLRKIKTDDALSKIPVVIVSGKVFPPEKKRAITLGAAAFLSKPIQGKNLVEEVKKFI